MLKSFIARILFTLIAFSVVVSPIYARLGDTEETVWSRNTNATISDSLWLDDHFKLIVFTHPNGEYCVGLIDGTVVIETFSFNEDVKLDLDTLTDEIMQYSDQWIQIKSPIEGCKAAVSLDGEVFCLIGQLKAMKSNRTMTVFSKNWKKYMNNRVKI